MATITSVGRASGFEPLEPVDDSRAAAALYERHSSSVFRYCLARLGRREDAEDAVQTTFLHAVRGLHRGVVPATEVAWLLGIARNVCLSRWESVGRRSRLESPCDPHELDRAVVSGEESRDELIGLEDALLQLPDQQRRAVLLRDWRGLSYEEIALQMDISHAAVETLIFRGRRTLAELLREEPQKTRSRLHALGNLGSFFSALKTALTGGAAATKIAMAAIAAVTLSGAGAVAGTSLHDSKPAPVQAPTPKPAGGIASITPQAPPAGKSSATPSPSARSKPTGPAATPTVASIPAAAAPTPTRPTLGTPAVATPVEESAHGTPSAVEPHATPPRSVSQPPPVPVPTAPPTEALVPTLTGVVEDTVNKLLPNLPVELPSVTLPPVELPPVEVPPVQVQLPAVPAVVPQLPAIVPQLPATVTVTVPPIEVTLPKLLP